LINSNHSASEGAGAISPIYNGESIEAIPTPIPATKREAINRSLFGANAMNNDEIQKTEAAINNPASFLSYLQFYLQQYNQRSHLMLNYLLQNLPSIH
jgi:hypothetical protein